MKKYAYIVIAAMMAMGAVSVMAQGDGAEAGGCTAEAGVKAECGAKAEKQKKCQKKNQKKQKSKTCEGSGEKGAAACTEQTVEPAAAAE